MDKKEEMEIETIDNNQQENETKNPNLINNELVKTETEPEPEPASFDPKIEYYLFKITEILKTEKKDNNSEKIDEMKKQFINSNNKEKIFELFFSIECFTSHLKILLNLFKLLPNEIDKQIKYVISKKNNQNTKEIYKLIIENASFFDNYIEKETLLELNKISIEINFSFYMKQYKDRKIRLIHLYNLFKDDKNIIDKITHILRNELKKEKQAELIEQKLYDEKSEYELEEKEFLEKNKNIYFVLPDDYKKYEISDNNKESEKILDELIKYNNNISDEYLGIDTEWKSYKTFLELYDNNLNDNSKNKGISGINKSNLSDIIQIAGKHYGLIIDTKYLYKNCKIRNKIKKLLSKKKFIGFGFSQDEKKIGRFFEDIIIINTNKKKNNFIELSNVYEKMKKKKAPQLSEITFDLFRKELDKRDRLSDWSLKPLLESQKNYGILDAYILILIHNKLNEK